MNPRLITLLATSLLTLIASGQSTSPDSERVKTDTNQLDVKNGLIAYTLRACYALFAGTRSVDALESLGWQKIRKIIRPTTPAT